MTNTVRTLYKVRYLHEKCVKTEVERPMEFVSAVHKAINFSLINAKLPDYLYLTNANYASHALVSWR